MNKKWKFASFVLTCALFCGVAGTTFVGCKDYDDDIDRIDNELAAQKTEIAKIQEILKSGQWVQSVTSATQEGKNGVLITMGNGDTHFIPNGEDGKNGGDGKTPVLVIKEKDGKKVFWDTTSDQYVGDVPVPEEGKKGDQGEPGVAGKSPFIINSSNVATVEGGVIGNWAVYDDTNKKWKDSGVKAQPDATTPQEVHPAYVVEQEGEFVLNIWNKEKKAYEPISLPKTTKNISDILFIPTTLSGGEAPIIYFPTIIQDNTDGVGNYDNNNQAIAPEYVIGTIPSEPNSILYSGKVDLKYQFNPKSVAFDAFEVLGLWKHGEATVITRSMQDGANMIFNKNQRYYDTANGVLKGEQSYGQEKEAGMLQFRAKAWRFAEMKNGKHDGSQRDILTLAVKQKDTQDTIFSEVAPMKHWHIAQKDVRIVNTDFENYPLNTVHENLYADKYRLANSYNALKAAKLDNTAQATADEYYKSLAPIKTFTIKYDNRIDNGGQGINLTEKFKTFFLENGEELDMMTNGFDDYQLKFQLVSFNNLGVDQTMRYLTLKANMEKAGTDERQLITTAYVNSPDQYPGFEKGDHSAAIGRTPIVRVMLVAPVEDGADGTKEDNVVASRLIKLEITADETPVDKIVIKDTVRVMLKHVAQFAELDMDHIYNDSRVQQAGSRGRDEFHSHYTFNRAVVVEVNAKHGEDAMAERKNDVALVERTEAGVIQNQLDIHVNPTAFSKDHIEYVIKGKYTDDGDNEKVYPEVNLEYTVLVEYPKVVAPEITRLNWQNAGNNGEGGLIYAHGRINPGANNVYGGDDATKGDDDSYDMVVVLNEMFDLNNYTAKAMFGTNPNHYNLDSIAKPTLSFELVNKQNLSSGWPVQSGVKLYKEGDQWKVELARNDAGRELINAVGEDGKRVKVRAVVSFNECIDGLYGTCSKPEYKYSKTAADKLPACTANDEVGKAYVHEASDYSANGGKAPKYGRSVEVIKEFEIAFITPIKFKEFTIAPLYDKYQSVENRAYLKNCFALIDYLYDGAQGNLKNDHVTYSTDFTNYPNGRGVFAREDNTTESEYGWSKYWKHVFGVRESATGDNEGTLTVNSDAAVTYNVKEAVFADGKKLDAENMKKIKLLKDADKGWYITWENHGQDIAEEFNIVVEVCVKHVWGEVCTHANKDANYGHSVGLLKVPVKFHK